MIQHIFELELDKLQIFVLPGIFLKVLKTTAKGETT